MPYRKFIYLLSLISLMGSCSKGQEASPVSPEDPSDNTFVIGATFSLEDEGGRTTMSGMETRWVSGDAINVFHAVAGTTNYINDGRFSTTSSGNRLGLFTGTLGQALSNNTSYDWYIVYPYDSNRTSPNETVCSTIIGCDYNGSESQSGLNNSNALCGSNAPLFGCAKGIASNAAVNVTVTPIFTTLEIEVDNQASQRTISSVTVSAPQAICGRFLLDISDGNHAYMGGVEDRTSESITLNVSSGTISTGGTGKFYIAAKPFTLENGESLTFSFTESSGASFDQTITYPSGKAFRAGYKRSISITRTVSDEVIINGIAWKTCNLGASSPDAVGNLYQFNRNTPLAYQDNPTGFDYSYTASESTYILNAWTNNPCPNGWRVANKNEVKALTDIGHAWRSYDQTGFARNGIVIGTSAAASATKTDLKGGLFIPQAGWISNVPSYKTVGLLDRDWCATLRTATSSEYANQGGMLWHDSIGNMGFGMNLNEVEGNKGNAGPVRCVRD